MNKTKIDWCDATWNPLTGCRHGCEYCYARRIANRFGTEIKEKPQAEHRCYVCESKIKGNPYPHLFEPTFHPYRLGEPAMQEKHQNIFVCSMSDLFGDWVPERWIIAVFKACLRAPQHRYLFLTKNSKRYKALYDSGLQELFKRDNFWFGTTVTKQNDVYFTEEGVNAYLSIEPIQEDLNASSFPGVKWIIIGAETGNRENKVIPTFTWIYNICEAAGNAKVYMKDNLGIIGPELRKEYPWEA